MLLFVLLLSVSFCVCLPMAKLIQKRRPALAFRAKDLKYCIFGLGDSHYWGKGTEDGVNLSTSLKDTL